MKVDLPRDPRLTPLFALRRLIPLPDEQKEDRKLLHRTELKDQLK